MKKHLRRWRYSQLKFHWDNPSFIPVSTSSTDQPADLAQGLGVIQSGRNGVTAAVTARDGTCKTIRSKKKKKREGPSKDEEIQRRTVPCAEDDGVVFSRIRVTHKEGAAAAADAENALVGLAGTLGQKTPSLSSAARREETDGGEKR